jgi:hypothetical protein
MRKTLTETGFYITYVQTTVGDRDTQALVVLDEGPWETLENAHTFGRNEMGVEYQVVYISIHE